VISAESQFQGRSIDFRAVSGGMTFFESSSALSFCVEHISAQRFAFVARENRFTLFRIMLLKRFGPGSANALLAMEEPGGGLFLVLAIKQRLFGGLGARLNNDALMVVNESTMISDIVLGPAEWRRRSPNPLNVDGWSLDNSYVRRYESGNSIYALGEIDETFV